MLQEQALHSVKTILGLTDSSKDALLSELLETTENAIQDYIEEVVPFELKFVLVEATIHRYHRIGSEAVTEEKIDVLTFKYHGDFLAPFKETLDKFIARKGGQTLRKTFRML